MRPALHHEIDRLEAIHAALGVPFRTNPPATEMQLEAAERAFGFALDPDLRDLYLYSNGSRDRWFVVVTDEPTLCEFEPLDAVLACRAREAVRIAESEKTVWRGMRMNSDERIAPYFEHPQRFGFAQFNGRSTLAMIDAVPGPKGSPGQVIAYQHDPDAMYWLAEDFVRFFAASNDLFEKTWRDLEKLLAD